MHVTYNSIVLLTEFVEHVPPLLIGALLFLYGALAKQRKIDDDPVVAVVGIGIFLSACVLKFNRSYAILSFVAIGILMVCDMFVRPGPIAKNKGSECSLTLLIETLPEDQP